MGSGRPCPADDQYLGHYTGVCDEDASYTKMNAALDVAQRARMVRGGWGCMCMHCVLASVAHPCFVCVVNAALDAEQHAEHGEGGMGLPAGAMGWHAL